MMSSEVSGECEYRDNFHPTMDFEQSYKLSGVL